VASQVEIGNRALIKLGSAVIASFSDNEKPARLLSTIWDTVRRAELRRAFWSFSIVRTTLPADGTAPSWGFGNAFLLPSDYLRLVQVNDFYAVPSMSDYREGDDSAYSIESGRILTDFDAPLKVRYVKDVTDPGQFDALFVEVMACALADELCEALTQSNQKRQLLAEQRKVALREAARVGAIEKPPVGIPDDGWMLARL
jgi:hypothetical protein